MWRQVAILIFCIHCATSVIITPIETPNINAGVSLYWDDCTKSLYFVDYLAFGKIFSIFRYDFYEKKIYSAYIDGEQSPIYLYPVKECNKYKDLFAVGFINSTKIIEWRRGSSVATVVSTLFEVQLENPDGRFVGGRPDLQGRLFSGTFTIRFCSGPANATFYRYSKGKGVQRIFGSVSDTTGIAYNPKAKKIYHLASCFNQISEFDYCEKTGDMCNGREVFDFRNDPNFYPLGMEADTDGLLYLPNYLKSSGIAIVDPRKSAKVGVIDIPLKLIASVAFGGPLYDILFAVGGSTEIDVATGQIKGQVPGNKFLYMISDLNAKGYPISRVVI